MRGAFAFPQTLISRVTGWPARYDFRALNDFTMGFEDVIEEKCGARADSAVKNILIMTGCTLKEAIDSYKNSKPLPILPHLAGYSYSYSEHRGGGATVTVSATNILASGAGPNPLASYGEATYSMTLKIDLSGEKPVATDVKLAQEFSI